MNVDVLANVGQQMWGGLWGLIIGFVLGGAAGFIAGRYPVWTGKFIKRQH